MKKWVSVIGVFVIINSAAFSQSTGGMIGVGVKGGLSTYFGDIKKQEYKPHFGFSMFYWLTDLYAMGLEVGNATLQAENDGQFFKSQTFYLAADLKLKLIRSGFIQPYILVGGEVVRINPKLKNGQIAPNNAAKKFDKMQLGVPVGGGFAFFVNDHMSIDLQAMYHNLATDYLDDIDIGGNNDRFLSTGLKLNFYFGGSLADNDQDGIPDKYDDCPKQSEDFDGFQDEDGCPDPDNDGDGIPDKNDKCPNQAEDPDGFQDEDGCPDTDNDQDGIPDINDKCPNKAEDLDGFQDSDGCPDPDNDNDGIPDVSDKCPNEAETVNGWEDDDGCPDEKPLVVLELRKPVVLDGVYFRTGSEELDPNSESILDKVAETLTDNPEIILEVHGHTDNVGNYEYNKQLSLKRAESVVTYLVSKGVSSDRLSAKGLGPDKPVAPNDTKTGRAKNRRIEFLRTR